jgi:hypothetical protein
MARWDDAVRLNTAGADGNGADGRRGKDRRRRVVPRLRYLLIGGRRKDVRRSSDRHAIVILDRYSPRLFAAITGILLLSVLDGLLTSVLIEHGATELNPVMACFLRFGPLVFAVAKYLLTSASVMVFFILTNSILPRYTIRPKRFFYYMLAAFGSVIAWEAVLIYLIPS